MLVLIIIGILNQKIKLSLKFKKINLEKNIFKKTEKLKSLKF